MRYFAPMETMDNLNLRLIQRIITQYVLSQPPHLCESCGAIMGPTPFDDLDPPGIDDTLCKECAT